MFAGDGVEDVEMDGFDKKEELKKL